MLFHRGTGAFPVSRHHRGKSPLRKSGRFMEEIRAAMRAVGLDDYVCGLPDGYETLLEEGGTNLSGGQKQRLSIARALLRKSEIVLMDEPTSALDAESEAEIVRLADTVLQGKTILTIAHKLNTIRNYDRIYVLDRGTIAEYGSHEELMAAGGLYYRLYTGNRETGFRENILCARPDASEEEVTAAAKAAAAHDFITALPGGYEHLLEDGGRTLSFGQRQRIAIARAFLKDAPIILFDEAVSGLDYESERAIMQSVERLIQNKTALIITHRDTEVWKADRKYFFTISH